MFWGFAPNFFYRFCGNVFNNLPKLRKWSKCDASKADWFSQAIIMLSGKNQMRATRKLHWQSKHFSSVKNVSNFKNEQKHYFTEKICKNVTCIPNFIPLLLFLRKAPQLCISFFISSKRIIITSTWWHRGCRRNITHR